MVRNLEKNPCDQKTPLSYVLCSDRDGDCHMESRTRASQSTARIVRTTIVHRFAVGKPKDSPGLTITSQHEMRGKTNTQHYI